jgi:ribose-phosphate pyrophosphokinase
MTRLLLDLTDISNSDISFKISQFPDGQQSVSITGGFDGNETIQLSSRMNSFKDIELIICANQALKEMGAKNVELYVPYFLGARSDRKFEQGQTNYLKNVICPIINSQGFTKVIVMDPHSDVLEACLNNFYKINNFQLVEFALAELGGRNSQTAIVSPDAGALKKIFDVAKEFNITNVITASKVRDIATGNIVRTELPTMDLRDIEHIIVIDDICDGGRTFIELAKAIKEITEIPIYLIVTHGIFSAGFEKLSDELAGIFCTDSIKVIDPELVKVQSKNGNADFVKQLNAF